MDLDENFTTDVSVDYVDAIKCRKASTSGSSRINVEAQFSVCHTLQVTTPLAAVACSSLVLFITVNVTLSSVHLTINK